MQAVTGRVRHADDPCDICGARGLTRKGLRTFCSINVRSAECIDPHYFAVLIGCGATVVNAYLARIRWRTGLSVVCLDVDLTDGRARYREAIDQGLLKIMAKMGISVDVVLSRWSEL